jgi:hypothetical protein
MDQGVRFADISISDNAKSAVVANNGFELTMSERNSCRTLFKSPFEKAAAKGEIVTALFAQRVGAI